MLHLRNLKLLSMPILLSALTCIGNVASAQSIVKIDGSSTVYPITKIVAYKFQVAKKDAARSLQLIQYFAPGIDNWAVCDAMGMQGLKPILKTHQKEIFALAKKYNPSKNFWERRLSLVLVEWYTRDPSLHAEIKKLVAPLENDPEYYVRKAVVWINKNFIKGR